MNSVLFLLFLLISFYFIFVVVVAIQIFFYTLRHCRCVRNPVWVWMCVCVRQCVMQQEIAEENLARFLCHYFVCLAEFPMYSSLDITVAQIFEQMNGNSNSGKTAAATAKRIFILLFSLTRSVFVYYRALAFLYFILFDFFASRE